MRDERPERRASDKGAETYGLRGAGDWERVIANRTAAGNAAFFLPHLKPGMRVLDVGCGPGSITVGLAEAVSPGETVGIDLQAEQVERARGLAAERGASNARFEVGDAYALPFADASFDAAFASNLLLHLAAPERAVRELRPAGVVGLGESDFGSTIFAPSTPHLEEAEALELRVLRHNGADPFIGRRLHGLVREAGFARTEAGATAVGGSAPERTRRFAELRRTRLLAPAMVETALGQGWAERERMEAMGAAWSAWGERLDAFYAWTYCTVLGWVSE